MKKVLIITTHFPPDAHVGAKRVSKFCKYFIKYGWEPVILTLPISFYHSLDASLLNDVPDGTPIIRPHHIPLFKPFDGHVLDYCFSWVLAAYIEAIRVIRKSKIDLIFSSAPNPEASLIGFLIKLKTKKKWICEFRDPVVDSSVSYSGRFRLYNLLWVRLTKLILKSADHIFTVSKTLKYNLTKVLQDCNKKTSVIYNGYDSEDFYSLQFKPNSTNVKYSNKMQITYIGSWGYDRTPEFFFQALESLFISRKELTEKINVKFFGEDKFDETPGYFKNNLQNIVLNANKAVGKETDPKLAINIIQSIKIKKLERIVTFGTNLPHREALRTLYSSDVLLLVQMPKPAQEGCLSSKFFEYLKVKKPILALVPHESEIAKIVEEADAGIIASPTDIKEIEKAILKMYELFKNNKLYVNSNKTIIKNFNREKQVAGVVEIFNLVVY